MHTVFMHPFRTLFITSLLGCSFGAEMIAQDQIFGILHQTQTGHNSIIKIETDGQSQAQLSYLHTLPPSSTVRGAPPRPDALAYAENVGESGSLFWVQFEADSLFESKTFFRTYRMDLATGSVITLSDQLSLNGEPHLAAGAWNHDPDVFEGVGYYLGLSHDPTRILYLGEGASSILDEKVIAENPPDVPGYLIWSDMEFTPNGILGTAVVDPRSGRQGGIFEYDGDALPAFLHSTWNDPLIHSNGNYYTLITPRGFMLSREGGEEGIDESLSEGFHLYRVDLETGDQTLISHLIEDGSYMITDTAGTGAALQPVPEPSGMILLGSLSCMILSRRRA